MIKGKIEGRIEVTGIRGRRGKQLLNGIKEKRGSWRLNEEGTAINARRTGFQSGYGPLVTQQNE